MANCKSVIMSNMWFGLMEFDKAGDYIDGHKHMFDHCTLLTYGDFRITKYEDDNIIFNEIVKAPCLIHIEKNIQHKIESLTDNAIACCCHAIYESEKSLFPIETDKVPVVGGSLKLSLVKNSDI